MTVYPWELDDDRSIIRIDDNLSELGTIVINQIREAIFAMQAEMGTTPSGVLGSISDRLDVSLNENGTIKSSALTSVGLATLPIHDNQVALNAGIKETKLDLDYETANLHTQLTGLETLLTSTAAFLQETNSDLLIHITGAQTLTDGSSPARHVASQIDLNKITPPPDPRDPLYSNPTGLVDKDGVLRSATTVQGALEQINDALVTHENLTAEAHPATAITVDTSNFTEIPSDATDVQKALDAIDDAETLNIGLHRAVMHDNGVPKTARSELINVDGYSQNLVPVTPCNAFLVRSGSNPVDNNNYGDDVVIFNPDNPNYEFDAQFAQVKVGDIIRINYGTGIEGIFEIDSLRFEPGNHWLVRINGTNLCSTDGYDGYARIDRKLYDDNTYGVLACAAANHYLPDGTNLAANTLSSIIVGNPRAATALGLGFDPNQLDSTHYLLYLFLYPTGNPDDHSIRLEGIDVTGNAGITPGRYTIDTVVQATNDALRAGGYNERFIAFNHKGEFGIMLSDAIDNASFSIANGSISSGSLTIGSFTDNVVDDVSTPAQDALGLGRSKAGLASPEITTYSTETSAANFPTLIIPPLKRRTAIVNGVRLDEFIDTYGVEAGGYWSATITDVTTSIATVETTYRVEKDLANAGLEPGKTITVQPTMNFSESLYNDVDYGRFVIKEVEFTDPCGGTPAHTDITVMNSVHNTGFATTSPSGTGLQVNLYFSADSVGFNNSNMVDAVSPSDTYNRYHEIYVTDEGRTFSHERVRMVHQGETDELLRTNQGNWTIRSVSPKLRGFRDDASTNDFRKWVRFQVVNYNSNTGEYDARIGRRDSGSGITEYGETARVRKNTPAKFYDATNVDYIELQFTDSSTASGDPAGAVMSNNTYDRYVDFEVFDSLALDDEVFLLAGCQLNDKVMTYVGDLREFGTISEKNFSASAISFIESGDRYLHTNGVIRGLTYQGPDPSDDQSLLFNGGIALVNGHISVLNDSKVRIPSIVETPGPTGTVDWAVCVNDQNQFVPIIVTSTKQEFFIAGTPSDYYVPSVTFAELVSTRKDLTPIAIVPVEISSFSILPIQDIRRRVADETISIPLTLAQSRTIPYTGSSEEFVGHFSSLEAAVYWAISSGGNNSIIKVRGTVTSAALTMSFNGNTSPLVLDGDGTGKIIMTGSLWFKRDIIFRNLELEIQSGYLQTNGTNMAKFENCTVTFSNSASGVYLDSNGSAFTAINSTVYFQNSSGIADTGNEFIVTLRDSTVSSYSGTWSCRDSSDYIIDNCSISVNNSDRLFVIHGGTLKLTNSRVYWQPATTSSTGTDYINTGNGVVYGVSTSRDIYIQNNLFSTPDNSIDGRPPFINFQVDPNELLEGIYIRDNYFSDSSSDCDYLAAIAIIGTTNGSGLSAVTNLYIENNHCREYQGIYLTQLDPANESGIAAINCNIINNNCGVIGALARPYFGSSFSSFRGENGNKSDSLIIRGNKVSAISNTVDAETAFIVAGDMPTTCSAIIDSNVTHSIRLWYKSEDTSTSALVVSNNIVSARDLSALPSGFIDPAFTNAGIIVAAAGTTNRNSVTVSGNAVKAGRVDSVDYKFVFGMQVLSGAVIQGNTVSGFTSKGIYGASYQSIIGNVVNRVTGETVASSLIEAFNTTSVIGNVFNQETLDDASNYNLLTANADSAFANINQRRSVGYGSVRGVTNSSGGSMTISLTPEVTIRPDGLYSVMSMNYSGGAGLEWGQWDIPLSNLPRGVQVVQVEVDWQMTQDGGDLTSGELRLGMTRGDFRTTYPQEDHISVPLNDAALFANTTYTATLTESDITGVPRIDEGVDAYVTVFVQMNDDTSTQVYFSAVAITYQWK